MKGLNAMIYKGRIGGIGGLGLERKDFRDIAHDFKKKKKRLFQVRRRHKY